MNKLTVDKFERLRPQEKGFGVLIFAKEKIFVLVREGLLINTRRNRCVDASQLRRDSFFRAEMRDHKGYISISAFTAY